jgi:hypothetical protein
METDEVTSSSAPEVDSRKKGAVADGNSLKEGAKEEQEETQIEDDDEARPEATFR